MYSVSRKKDTKMFFVISSIKLGRFWWNFVYLFLDKFSAKSTNFFHLTPIHLHYLVKLEMLVRHVLLWSYNRKKLQILSHFNCGLQIRQIWIRLITACEDYCKRRCTKYAFVIWTNWNSDWERSGPSWIMSLRQPFVSGVFDSCRSVMSVLYTVSCNIFHMLLSIEFKSGEFGDDICIGNKFWSWWQWYVARAYWAFQVSQGSVETLFRWGGKRLHHFAANLFRKQCTKFRRYRLSF